MYAVELVQEKTFYNILDNAVNTVSTKRADQVDVQQEEQFVKIQVRDYGIGLNRERKNAVFKRFYQENV